MRIETTRDFVDHLSAMTFPDVFNPYTDICGECDLPQAHDIRRENLVSVLDAVLRKRVSSIWIGRDLGFRGGRRTGLALTDEIHLEACTALLRSRPLHRATHGGVRAEQTAKIIWDLLSDIRTPVFLWNVFPFHPHLHESPMTNRAHRRWEAETCSDLLLWLLDRLAVNHIVAIGRDARSMLYSLGIEALSVRHPSYGGKTDFLASMRDLHHLSLAHRR